MKEDLQKKLAEIVQEAFDQDVQPLLTRPDEQFGDFATNIAMQLAGKIGKNPREIAQIIIDKLEHELVVGTDIAGAGFINITLADKALEALANIEVPKNLTGKTIVAEYSDPNPFKVLHAGHLYTSIVGDAIARLLENAGASVRRVNFGGDVGLHVATTMWAILEEIGKNPDKLDAVPADERLDWLSQRYVTGTAAYADRPELKDAIIELNKKIYRLHEDKDEASELAQIYWKCRQWSYDGFDALYERLGMVPFDKYYPESQTTPLGTEFIHKGLETGVFEKSDDAVVFKGEKVGLHTRVFLTSNGLPTYETKDLGLAVSKWQDYQFDESIMITGNDIVEYMKVVLAALSHFHPEIAERSRHLTHGMIKLAGGVKMSSRKGNILRAVDVLEAAAQASKEAGNNSDYIVLGAVKYAFLKQRTGGDIIYDPKESVALEGNSGPYLQYAHARARSILKKAEAARSTLGTNMEKDERSLLRKIGEYAESVEAATAELMPHHICTYLYELAQTFNRFYEKNRVLGDERQALRLYLVAAYADTLKNGLELLGIEAPEQM